MCVSVPLHQHRHGARASWLDRAIFIFIHIYAQQSHRCCLNENHSAVSHEMCSMPLSVQLDFGYDWIFYYILKLNRVNNDSPYVHLIRSPRKSESSLLLDSREKKSNLNGVHFHYTAYGNIIRVRIVQMRSLMVIEDMFQRETKFRNSRFFFSLLYGWLWEELRECVVLFLLLCIIESNNMNNDSRLTAKSDSVLNETRKKKRVV